MRRQFMQYFSFELAQKLNERYLSLCQRIFYWLSLNFVIFRIYIQMHTILILILLPAARALDCTNFYDYTGDTIQCKQSCPSSANVKDSKCLLKTQYLIGQDVHLCDRGWVDSSNTVCCPKKYYISTNNNTIACAKCHTRVYANGKLCCPGSHYADLSLQDSLKCTPLGSGNCGDISLKSIFKVCCPSGMYYSIEQQKCVFPTSYNCDTSQRICCSQGRKLQYAGKQYICVSTCNWGDSGSFYCQKRSCSLYNESLTANGLQINHIVSKISIKSQCCYGLSDAGGCIDVQAGCQRRFVNRGWSVCCPAGNFYSPKASKCSDKCQGIIILEFFCISEGSVLSLQGTPTEVQSQICNGKKLPSEQPYCCPAGFYINNQNGCQICNGRIFKTNNMQFCCAYNQIFNSATGQCQACQGKVNKQGTLCCSNNQFFGYSTSGQLSCLDSCISERRYRTDYCCQSLTNTQCQIKGFTSTSCNPSYYQDGTCQACPSFCSLGGNQTQMCSTDQNFQCQKSCDRGTIYSSQIGQCVSCDSSCLGCSQPFDPHYCTTCQDGFTMIQGLCSRCSPQCLTCSSAPSSCLSCPANSNRPLLVNGKCIPDCGNSKYFEYSNATCCDCHSSCKQCNSQGSNQCTKCQSSFVLSSNGIGVCLSCASGCLSCYLSSNRCYQCTNTMSLDQNQQCVQSCSQGNIGVYNPSLGHSECVSCHPNCLNCQYKPQNCLSCLNSSYYMNDQTGLNLCYPCPLLCLSCSSASNCLQCSSGFVLQNGSCVSKGCSSLCQQCDSTNCLVCKFPYYLYNGSCFAQCPTHTYISGAGCSDCPASCSTCTSSTECVTCPSNYPFLQDQLCVSQCSTGYVQYFGNCIKHNPNPNPNNNSNNSGGGGWHNEHQYLKIQTQTIDIPKDSKSIIVTTLLTNITDPNNVQLDFYLLNLKTNLTTKLNATKTASISNAINQLRSSLDTTVTYSVEIPSNASLKDSILLTSVNGNANSSTYFNGRSIFDFIAYDYISDPLMGLQYVGLSFTILITIFSIITKLKGHFIAQQSNTLILHMLNFIQVVYLFKFTRVHSQGMYHFLNGFGFMHYLMFPNFFYSTIPSSYIQYPAEKSLIPDGNFIRNAGSSISLLLIVLLLTGVAFLVSFLLYKMKQLDEMPQIRKITRISILAVHITFLNIVFASTTFLFQPSLSNSNSFWNSTKVAAIIMLIFVILISIGIAFHFYKTYNSDVLQHYYTLRQAAAYLLIICQGFLFSFSIGKPLLCLFLIVLEIVWFMLNFFLYKYGQGDNLRQHIKFIVASLCICIAYLFLSLSAQVSWIAIVVIVSLVVTVLIIYSIYQVVGLYYNLIFRKKAQQLQNAKGGSDQGTQPKEIKTQVDKQSQSKL